jgi:riboflavin kinase/FMN adenylyltransferase
VVVGHDWAFGRGRAGDSTFLTDAGRRHGFSVIIVPPVIEGGERVSTTRVKEALSVGDTEKLTLFLGRHYTVIGRVCRGEGRGRQIGVPTANLATRLQLLPKNGVYVTRARIGGEVFGAVTNIGTRPTFSGVGRTVETHLLDGGPHSLYGAKLELQFIGRIRDEERFATVDDLIAQIKRDRAVAQERLRSK